MAINIQYGPVQSMLEAAAATGQGRYRQQAQQRDQALLSDVMRYRLGQQQLEQEATRMQDAYRPRLQRAPAQSRVTQFGSAPQRTQARPSQVQAGGTPISFAPTSEGTGTLSANGRNYGFDATGGLVDLDTDDEVRGKFVTPGEQVQAEHPFMQYAAQVAQRGNIDPAKLAELGAATQMAIQTGMTGNQFQNMVSELSRQEKPALSPQFVASQQVDAIDRDIRQIEREIKEQEEIMRAGGVDPNGPPSQLVPGEGGRGFFEAIGDTYRMSTANLQGEGPDPEAANAYRRKVQLQQQMQRLNEQRAQTLNSPTTAPTGGGPSIPFIDSQAAYDALPSGAQFREDPNGPILVKE